MGDAIPAKLRQADLVRYMNRANQLRQVKPAISYWCDYWVISQILAKSLQNADNECLAFTSALMDKLERTKQEHADDDAITDDTAGQAVVEQFAQQTFERAEKVLQANKVTRQTADTFDAAATFFSLSSIWGRPDEETQRKIIFSKYNAARILKAIKDGRDPNDSNPKREVEAPEMPPLDPDDPDVRRLRGSGVTTPSRGFEDMADQRGLAISPPDISVPPSVSPDLRQPSPQHPISHRTSQGYFPPEPLPPSPLSQRSVDSLPHFQPDAPHVAQSPYQPALPPHPQAPSPWTAPSSSPPPSVPPPGIRNNPADLHSYPPPARPSIPPEHFAPSAPRDDRSGFTPAALGMPPLSPPEAPRHQSFVPHQMSHPQPAPPTQWQSGQGTQQFTRDERDINNAQKHAKWAISALNFDDVPTAVKELRSALAALGAGPMP